MRQQFPTTELGSPERYIFRALQVVVLLAALAFLGLAVHRYATSGSVFGNDFSVLWTATQTASTEDLKTAYSEQVFATEAGKQAWGAEVGNRHHYLAYPPHFLLYVWPFGTLSYEAAFFVYALINPAILGLVVWAAFQRSWNAACFAVLAPAAFFSLWVGQTGMLACALLIGGMAFLERRPVLAGILIGLLTFKPPLGVLVPFALLAGRYWRTFIAAAATVVALLVASLVIHGPEVWITYLTSIPNRHLDLYQGAGGLLSDLVPTVIMAARLLGFAEAVGQVAQLLVSAVVIACVIWAFRRRRDLALNSALLFTGTLLASPFGHVYDMSMVSVAVYLLLQDMAARGGRSGELTIAVFAWLLPILVFFLNGAGIPVGPLGLGLLFGALMARLWRLERQPSAQDARTSGDASASPQGLAQAARR